MADRSKAPSTLSNRRGEALKLKMSNEKIPVPKKDEVNTKFLCCFPTTSLSGKRVNGYQVVEKSYDEQEQVFILGLKGQVMLVKLTRDLIKSLHIRVRSFVSSTFI